MVKAVFFKKAIIQFCLLLGCSCGGQETYHLGFSSVDTISISNPTSDTVKIDSVDIQETMGSGYALYMIFFTNVGIYIQGFNAFRDRRDGGNTQYKKWPIVLKPDEEISISKISVDFLDPFGTADYILPRKDVYHEFNVRFFSESIPKEINVVGDVGLWEILTSIRKRPGTGKMQAPAQSLHSVDGRRIGRMER